MPELFMIEKCWKQSKSPTKGMLKANYDNKNNETFYNLKFVCKYI